MDFVEDYFPTKALRIAEAKMALVLRTESERLYAIGRLTPEICKSTLPLILRFASDYHEAYMGYLAAALPQHKNGVTCGAGCGNCCHHYPMSIEPFELFSFYASIRNRDDLFSILEACIYRQEKFADFISREENSENISKDPEEDALHDFFASNLTCPFLLHDGRCGEYAARPVTCRMYFSETPSAFCTPEWLQTEKNRSFIVYLPDYIEEAIAEISAYYDDLELPEALYAGIVRMNALDGEIFR